MKFSNSEPDSKDTNNVYGFPSPAEDYLEPALKIGDLLVKNARSTFYFRSKKDRKQYQISRNDIIIVDRQIQVFENDLIVYSNNNEFLVDRYNKTSHREASINREYNDSEIFGVITSIVKQLK